MAVEEALGQPAPAIEVDHAAFEQEEVPHVGGDALGNVPHAAGARLEKVIGSPFRWADALDVPRVVQFMGSDADQLHVAFFRAAFCRRPLRDDCRVFVLHAVAHSRSGSTYRKW